MNAYFAEFIGTMVMILLGDGVVANVVLSKTKGNGSGWMVITTAWALAVFAAVVIAGPFSGAHLNPAITLGFAVAGKFAWCAVVPYIVAQLSGAALGAVLVWLFYYDHFNATDNPQAKLGVFCTVPEIRHNAVNLFCEVLGTFVLVFVVFYIDGAKLTDASTDTVLPIGLGSVGAIPVAFTVWVIGLALGGTTGYAINPARDLAPRCVHALLPIRGKAGSNWNYAWIPVAGPIFGSLIATCLFVIIS